MCGIAGLFQLDGRPVDERLLARMSAVQEHRGPDDHDQFVDGPIGLAHRRLSIIDLTAAGRQPMASEDGRIVVVFNGEIYNYLELVPDLQRRGHHFRSRCDTEVIVHAYEEYGADCLRLFNGMFAIAVWDTFARRLWLARDRLGVKPLYYATVDGTFMFASEIKALRQHPRVGRAARADAIAQYLRAGYSTDDGTWFEGIHKLLPGWTAVVSADTGTRLDPYWDPIHLYRNPQPADDVVPLIRSLLEDSVRLRLRSDVPVGAHLSGGLDSSTVVALMAQHSETPVHTFSGAFGEGGLYDERPFINAVVDQYRTVHHGILPTADDFRQTLSMLTWHMDEPEVGPSLFPQYMVCRLTAQEGIKVVNGGQGGDELFAGYTRYLLPYWRGRRVAGRRARLVGMLNAGAPRRAVREVLERHGGRLWSGLHSDFANRTGFAYARVPHRALHLDDPLADAMYADLRYYIPGLLHVEDRTSMAVSVESRIPFLDYRLVELAASISPYDKMAGGNLKSLLREAVRDILPPTVAERRDKRGFPTPIGPWFRGKLTEFVAATLRSEAMREARVYDHRYLDATLAVHRAERFDMTRILWPAVAIASWFERMDVQPAW
jgi:asparagine synthase (glutamine-hydrolysing)